MRRFVLMICIVACCLLTHAQQPQKGSITLRVISAQQTGLENATVELLKAKDSSLAKVAITDKEGNVLFENIPPGTYLARISIVNFTTHYSSPVELSEAQTIVSIPAIILLPKSGNLSGVTVTARKPFIQKLTDRIVVNVENSIVSAGSSAMEVLERSPGVNIDQNDVISLRGKSGVIIMIDGKPTAMSGADLANYLKGLPSAAIERIDIITNPSAKYDASGNAGIIDIRMKKDQRLGTNGTYTVGYGQGLYPKANAGATFNYRNKKVNVFGNYNHGYFVGLNHLILDRSFYNNGVYNGGDLKDNYAKTPFHTNTARFGADFFPGKKTIIGFVVNGTFNHIRRNSTN